MRQSGSNGHRQDRLGEIMSVLFSSVVYSDVRAIEQPVTLWQGTPEAISPWRTHVGVRRRSHESCWSHKAGELCV